MKLEDLLGLKHITYDEYEVYMLFACSEMGREWFNKMVNHTFMDEPSPDNCIGEAFAYTDGRRSIFRNIKCIIEKINQLIKEVSDDNSNPEPE